jgi:hypothetical protein
LAVRAVGETKRELARIVLGLAEALGDRFVPSLGLDDAELVVPVHEHVVGDHWLPAPTESLDAAGRDGELARDLAALHDTPTRRGQRWIDVLGSWQ